MYHRLHTKSNFTFRPREANLLCVFHLAKQFVVGLCQQLGSRIKKSDYNKFYWQSGRLPIYFPEPKKQLFKTVRADLLILP